MGRNCSPSTSLAPGFRFHPTDEELVWYYLRRKVSGKPFRLDAISEIDIYKVEPSDLPGLSKLKTRDLEWYFFSALDRKYGNGSRTNRATNEGYWKTTGKDRPVYHRSRVVGMKKTLVYHKGRAPRGDRSNWVMHEYKINDKVLEKAGFSPDGYVLCRVFQKSGTGPKNGEQYGAPLVEEEWEDSGEVLVPTEVSFEDPYADDDACIQQNDLDPVVQLPAFAPCPVSFDHADSNNYCSQDVIGNDQISVGETEDKFSSGALDGQKLYDCMPDGSNACFVKNEHMVKPYDSGVLTLDDLFFDAPDAPVDDDGSYLDASKLNPHDFGIYESAWDDLGIDFASYDPLLDDNSLSELMGNNVDNIVSTKQNVINETWQMPSASQQLPEIGDDGNALSTNCTMEVSKTQPSNSDTQSPCLTWASRLMLDIPTPPSYASELPSKDLAAHLSAAVRSSTSVHLTAGMIRIRDMPIGVNGSGLQWSFDKTGNVNVLLSFDLPQAANPVRLEPLTSFLSKASTATSRGWLCFMFFIVFVFGFTIKFGTCIYAK